GDGGDDLPFGAGRGFGRVDEERLIVGADFAGAELANDAAPQVRRLEVPRRQRDDAAVADDGDDKQLARARPALRRIADVPTAVAFPPREQPRRLAKQQAAGQLSPTLDERAEISDAADETQLEGHAGV